MGKQDHSECGMMIVGRSSQKVWPSGELESSLTRLG